MLESIKARSRCPFCNDLFDSCLMTKCVLLFEIKTANGRTYPAIQPSMALLEVFFQVLDDVVRLVHPLKFLTKIDSQAGHLNFSAPPLQLPAVVLVLFNVPEFQRQVQLVRRPAHFDTVRSPVEFINRQVLQFVLHFLLLRPGTFHWTWPGDSIEKLYNPAQYRPHQRQDEFHDNPLPESCFVGSKEVCNNVTKN